MTKKQHNGVLPRSNIEVRMPPGAAAPGSGIYEQVGPRGGRTGQQAVSSAGRTLPPTSTPGHKWTLVVGTKKK
jgi:hypothetical protein